MLALTLMMALFIISAASGFSAIAAPAAGDMWPDGKGTKSDPYVITTAEQLNVVRDDLAAHYILGNDIDLTAFLAADKAGWQPIGASTAKASFTGSLDGDGYKITGLWIDRGNKKYMGLFGCATGATIKNLGLELATAGIKGAGETGGLAGKLEGGTIEGCYVKGSVNGGNCTGGLVGRQSDGGIIENCYFSGSVSGKEQSGGLVGSLSSSNIAGCYFSGNVSGNDQTGGLVGSQDCYDDKARSSISNCYASGNVSGDRGAGGLVGMQSDYSSITNCYATCDISGGDFTGGVVGWQVSFNRLSLTNCYFAGAVRGRDNPGGLVGRQDMMSSIIFRPTGSTIQSVVGPIKYSEPVGQTEPGVIDLQGCYRYESTTVNGKIVAESDKDSAPDKIHGGIKSVSELTTKDTYERNGWKFGASGPWYWDDGLFPKLNLGEEKNPFGFSFTIIYHLNDGMQQDGAPKSYIHGQALILPTPISVKGDHNFAGWYDNAAFTGNAINAITDSDTGDKEFWARWEDAAPDYPIIAKPTAATVLVNGKNVAFDAYNISGNNYFKLRDLAYVLFGTVKQFEIGWDAANNAISLSSGQPYSAVGGEMQGKGVGEKIPIPTRSKIYLDGTEVQFTAYTIEGNNYFKLRDIGQTFDFGVGWDATTNTITIDTSTGYGE